MTLHNPPADDLQRQLEELLGRVAAGELPAQDAASRARQLLVRDLGYAQVDTHRNHRRGRPEAIYCEGKTPQQVVEIARTLAEARQNVLMTRMDPAQMEAVDAAFPAVERVRNEQGRIMMLRVVEPIRKTGIVAVVCAGTTDIPVAEEAAFTAESLGSRVERLYDAGVAGLHRLLRHRQRLEDARVLIVVAGMEGALPSVVGGLVRAPVIAVPTSVGYGASFGGVAALLGMLNSCAPGLSVVNIDNGFGAGYLADVINGIGENPG